MLDLFGLEPVPSVGFDFPWPHNFVLRVARECNYAWVVCFGGHVGFSTQAPIRHSTVAQDS